MLRVRLHARMNVAGRHLERGAEVDVPVDLATSLVAAGMAVLVRGVQPETPERVVLVEKTTRGRR